MKHPLFVGYFDVSARSYRPRVAKPINLDQVRAILLDHCDKEIDGTPIVAELGEEADLPEGAGKWLGRIAQEDVHVKAGYLICPWLSGDVNQRSIQFICELHESLGVQIYEPDDATYLSPETLAEAGRGTYGGELMQGGDDRGKGTSRARGGRGRKNPVTDRHPRGKKVI
jgi:hypothetical protein